MNKNLKVAMLQLNFTVGDFKGNARKIINGYKRAVKKGAELVVSTELALFGYPPKDMLLQPSYLAEQDNYLLNHIEKAVGEVGLIMGLATKKIGEPLYNSAVLIQNGVIKYRHRKCLLPNYDVFDERRYFEPAEAINNYFWYNKKKIAILVCEDIWNNENGKNLYKNDPIEKLKYTNLDCLIVINASPYCWGKNGRRYMLVSNIAIKLKCPVVYVNQAGGNDDLIFDGTSFAVNEKLELLAIAKSFKEDLIVFDTKGKTLPTQAYHFDDGRVGYVYDALVMGTRDYAHKSGFKKAVLGLSGGVDSALVAKVAVDALGKDNVVGVAMSSKYSSKGSLDDAQELADNLGIDLLQIPIKRVVNAYEREFKRLGISSGGVAEENIQARIRGNYLMYLSNKYGYLVLTTGNKSEISVGYCTLHGDMAGGLAVISDVYKTLVYKLVNYVNYKNKREIIPQTIIDKEPSAELRPGQKDSDSLPAYNELDIILNHYIEKREGAGEICRIGLKKETVEKVLRMVNKAEHKRWQMAPGLKVTTTAFGTGRRWPIAAKF